MTKSKRKVDTTRIDSNLEWKPIPNFSWYEISELGQIYDVITETMKPQYDNGGGYMQVNLLGDDGVGKRMYVHRMVYQAFRGAIPRGLEINHKDENKANNNIENLEAITHTENQNYGTRSKRAGKARQRPIAQYTLNGKLVRTYDSMTEATEYGYGIGHLCACCTGRQNQYKGYIWKYAS